MTKILYNKKGVPLMTYGRTFITTTKGAPKNSVSKQNLKAQVNEKAEKTEILRKLQRDR